jgi:hypothetical protein
MSTTKTEQKNLITGVIRLSYAQRLWEPSAMDDAADSKKKYGTAMLIPKTDTKTLAEIEEHVKAAIEVGIKKLWGGKKPAKLKLPLRYGDEEHPDKPEYAGMYFLNANSDRRPGLMFKKDGKLHPILNRDELDSGDYAIVAINFYPFNGKQNGIAVGLQNVLKVRTGERFAGGSNPEDDFAGVEVDIDEADDLL